MQHSQAGDAHGFRVAHKLPQAVAGDNQDVAAVRGGNRLLLARRALLLRRPTLSLCLRLLLLLMMMALLLGGGGGGGGAALLRGLAGAAQVPPAAALAAAAGARRLRRRGAAARRPLLLLLLLLRVLQLTQREHQGGDVGGAGHANGCSHCWEVKGGAERVGGSQASSTPGGRSCRPAACCSARRCGQAARWRRATLPRMRGNALLRWQRRRPTERGVARRDCHSRNDGGIASHAP